jgi:starch phosphorylase
MNNYRILTPNSFQLPARIHRLSELAYNLYWTWHPEAQKLFQYVNSSLWEDLSHNAIAFLRKVDRISLNAAANDRFFLERYDSVMEQFDHYMVSYDTWFDRTYPHLKEKQIAYFSFEFGLHESFPVYAGGLGVLSGDHVKEASDLGLPLVGMGFVYREGYFTQAISESGWQEDRSQSLKFDELPLLPVVDDKNNPFLVTVNLPDRDVYARVWCVQVGRVRLFLLDTNLEKNNPADRQITNRLYNSEVETRISQEFLLGVGGVRALRLLGFQPDVWHMNEGHSAFLTVERLRELVAEGESVEKAMDQIRHSNTFTTHTPVPAGNDEFPIYLIEKYFSRIWQELGLNHDQFIDLARHTYSWGDNFSMPILALRLSEQRNAVSELHGEVSRRMWSFLWPEKSVDEVPIDYITNGVHHSSWLARRMGLLFARHFGAGWQDRLDDPEMWSCIDNIPDGEIWAVRQHLKRKLISFATQRARKQWMTTSFHPVQVIASGVLLDQYALTIGFARRFSTYKRAYLILRDFERLLKIINNPEKPVQIIFAGKAHPSDEPGKLVIQEVYRAVKDAKCGGRLVFLENYDMNVARYLVQGVDVWLNTPRRPNEASGTSGMKAALNGVLNFSVLDGWWREAYNGRNGWAIGSDMDYPDSEQQDAIDSASLYDTLEKEIIPLYYQGHSTGSIPNDWIARMKESIRTLSPQFSTRRMVKEYVKRFYLPAMNGSSGK